MPEPGTFVAAGDDHVILVNMQGQPEKFSVDVEQIFGDIVETFSSAGSVIDSLDLDNLDTDSVITLVDSLSKVYDSVDRGRLLLSAAANVMRHTRDSLPADKWPNAVLAMIAGRCQVQSGVAERE